MKLIGGYTNGNYKITLFDNGTKIRKTEDDDFKPNFSENCDCKITNKCDMGCAYCHENSTPEGKHGDILNAKFLDTLHPYTEIAIGGGNALSHPDLVEFLKKLKDKRVIANITINQFHLINSFDFVQELIEEKLINGIGISLCELTDNFIETVKKIPNAVIHVINGIITPEDLLTLSGNDLKILILGYKRFRRGNDWFALKESEINDNSKWLKENLKGLIKDFQVISFDNLAIEQLDVKKIMSEENWEKFYMGDDGTMTFYIDMVEEEFAKSSTSTERYKILDNIDDMFEKIKESN